MSARWTVLVASAAALIAASTLLAFAPLFGGGSVAPARPASAPTRPAAKAACPRTVPARMVRGLEPSNRVLVPLSSTLLGARDAWSGAHGSRTLTVLSGGYVDDITQAYDNLRPAQPVRMSRTSATVLTTVFLHKRVWVAFWREPGVAPPCDVHAVLASGVSRQGFYAVLEGMH